MTTSGDLRRYEWRELGSGKAQATVEPSEDFLLEHVVPNSPAAPSDQTFLLPLSTMVLEDYVFSHREILAWRYLAQSCGGKLEGCKPGRLRFGVLLPTQRSSTTVSMEYAGLEKITLRGVPHELHRINLGTEGATGRSAQCRLEADAHSDPHRRHRGVARLVFPTDSLLG